MDIERIKAYKAEGYNIAIWGAGKNGYTFSQIFQKFGIALDFFIDNDPDKDGKKITGNITCHLPQWLFGKGKTIVYICIAPDYYEEIYAQAEKIDNVVVGKTDEILDDMIVHYQKEYFEILDELPYIESGEVFYRISRVGNLKKENYRALCSQEESCVDKVAVYTGVFGSYDNMIEPSFLSEKLDYYYISDEKPEDLKVYKWIDAHDIVPSDIKSPIKRNRYIKMHPHIIFPQYEHSIYIDGNIEVVGDISVFIRKSELGIGVFDHCLRDDIYYEALAVKNARRVNTYDVYRQIVKYMSEGMPPSYGLMEMRVIARAHHKEACVDIMEKWWEEFDNMSQRDQLSFMYVLWKNKKSKDDLTIIGNNPKECPQLELHEHIKISEYVANEKKAVYKGKG